MTTWYMSGHTKTGLAFNSQQGGQDLVDATATGTGACIASARYQIYSAPSF